MVTKKNTSRSTNPKTTRTIKSKSTSTTGTPTPPVIEYATPKNHTPLTETVARPESNQDQAFPQKIQLPTFGDKPIVAENIIGFFDTCEGGRVQGWVANIHAINEPLEIEILVDGLPIARAIANLFRQDLLAEGIGKGNNGFNIMLSKTLFDGGEHLIEVREISSQLLLTGSPRAFRSSSDECISMGELLENSDASEESYQQDEIDISSINFDLFMGFSAHGWAYSSQQEQPFIKVVFGEKVIGKFKTHIHRQDVKESLGIEIGHVGFEIMLGGLLHFSALANRFTHVGFKQISQTGKAAKVDLTAYYSEAYTFAPLKSFSRSLSFPSPGIIKGANCFAGTQFSLLLEVGETAINGNNKMLLDFYQEDTSGKLKIVGQFDVELAGQLVNLEFDLVSKERPILIVVADASQSILLTDCIPLPVIFMAQYEPLIEYHSLLANGQSSFDVAAKISRGFLDFQLTAAMGRDAENIDEQPHRKNTAVLLFVRENFDVFPLFDAQYYRHISDHIAFLDRNGLVRKEGANLGSCNIQQFLAESDAEFFLLCEISNALRPDFWSIINGQQDRPTHKPALVYWDSIWLEGASRPYWVKNNLLCHEEFNKHTLAPINAVIVARKLLLESVSLQPETFRSGCLRPENAFYFVNVETINHLPVAMDIYRLHLLPQVTQRFINAQTPLPDLKLLAVNDFSDNISNGAASTSAGVSVVINFRNSVEVTIRCLQSIRLQRFDGQIEVILVNNGSTFCHMQSIIETATRLFGESNIKTIDYNERFNHSRQCNLAVQQASHDYILLLSNDAILISQDAIAHSLKIASVPWVGTCGFRMIAIEREQSVLKSFGLKLSASRYLFSGACPLATNKPPAFVLDYTIGTSGNTFAAVMIRKAVYVEVGGLDEYAFQTDYNDVDFCLRAMGKNYRHVIIGDALISHSGRGTREMNLDLPINQRIIERLPILSTLVSNFDILPL
jgi:GT2 family glycosyltransferase